MSFGYIHIIGADYNTCSTLLHNKSITCATSVIPSLTRGQSLRMKPYSKNLCRELSATPVIGPVVAGDSTTAKKGRRYLEVK